MNFNPEPTPPKVWAQELRAVWQVGFANFLRRLWILALVAWFGVLVVWLQHGQDHLLLHQLQSDNETVNSAARFASFWGDWPFWAALGVLLWAAGAKWGRKFWREAGLACLLATLMAGVTINCFRPLMGRPRPYTEIPDGFYGPHTSTQYHAFMSGHTAASFAAATALVIFAPPIGIPAAAGAAVVGWSRMQLGKHNPTDVMTGGAVGIFWGWCFARTVGRQKGK